MEASDPPVPEPPLSPSGSGSMDRGYSSKGTWLLRLAVIFALGMISGYAGYLIGTKKSSQITRLLGGETKVVALDQRLESAETKLRDLTNEWRTLGERVTALEHFERSVSLEFQRTRNYSRTLVEDLHQRMGGEIEARTAALDLRIQQLELQQKASQSQLARDESELHQELASAQESNKKGLSSVQERVEINTRDLGSLSLRLNRKRVDFEVTKGQGEELVPGVSLQISRTSNKQQRYRGSLILDQDQITLPLRDEGVDRPLQFYDKESADPFELTVTAVTDHSVIGFLLSPAQQESAAGTQTGAPPTSNKAGSD